MARVKYLEDSAPYQEGDVVEVSNDSKRVLEENGTAEEVSSDTPVFIAASGVNADMEAQGERERAALQHMADNSGRAVTGFVLGEEVTVEPGEGAKPAKKGKTARAKKDEDKE